MSTSSVSDGISTGSSVSITVSSGLTLTQGLGLHDSALIINSTGASALQALTMHDAATYVGQVPPTPTLVTEYEVDETPDLFAEG